MSSGPDQIRKAMRQAGLDARGRIVFEDYCVATRRRGWHFEPHERGPIQYLGRTVKQAVANVKAVAEFGR